MIFMPIHYEAEACATPPVAAANVAGPVLSE
jgi:hypothetical protein